MGWSYGTVSSLYLKLMFPHVRPVLSILPAEYSHQVLIYFEVDLGVLVPRSYWYSLNHKSMQAEVIRPDGRFRSCRSMFHRFSV
jgi:hypothetical protein